MASESKCPPNPLPCGCQVVAVYRLVRGGIGADRHVRFCPLHEAAPALLKALEDIESLDVRFASAGYARANKAVRIARAAIAKAHPAKEMVQG